MRIAVPIDHLRPGKGGLEAWVFALARRGTARGDEIHSVTMDPVGPGEPFLHHHIPPRGLTRAARDLDFARRAREFTGEGAFDVVLGLRHILACDVYAPHGGSVADAFAAHRRAKRLPSLPGGRLLTFLRLERELLTGPRPPRVVLAVSNRVRDDLLRRYPGLRDRIRVVPNGVDLERFEPSGREAARAELVPEGGRVVLFAAANPRLKGWRHARAAFERLRDAGGAERLLVAGGNPGHLPRGGRWLGMLPDLGTALRAADVLLTPTHYDPFPLLVLEALACGTPVVTTRANGAVAHVGEGGPVRVAKAPEDVDGLVAGLEAALANPDREEARRRAERFPEGASLDAAMAILSESGR